MHLHRQQWLVLLFCATLALQESCAFLFKLPKLLPWLAKKDAEKEAFEEKKLAEFTKFFDLIEAKKEKAANLFNIFVEKEEAKFEKKEEELEKIFEAVEAKKTKELELIETKKLAELSSEELPAPELPPEPILPAKKSNIITRRLPCDVLDTGDEKYFS